MGAARALLYQSWRLGERKPHCQVPAASALSIQVLRHNHHISAGNLGGDCWWGRGRDGAEDMQQGQLALFQQLDWKG